jgi:DNA repair protein RecO (recombination protein O)
MDWTDQGLVLSARPHGEVAAIAMLLTREHGRHAGLVPGGRTARGRGDLEPGTLVAAHWRGRLAEHLGTWRLEAQRAYAAGRLDDPLRLGALSSALALTESTLAEREPHPRVFDGLVALLEVLDTTAWAEAYVGWEIGLLGELGFGLDLTRCAVTGDDGGRTSDRHPADSHPADRHPADRLNDRLAWVSPRTGRAVSLSAGEPYRDRLLALPGFLLGQGAGGVEEVRQGLALTGHFLERQALGAALPPARQRFVERYGNMGMGSARVPP